MRRGVGFFSDESIGYRYSGQLAESRKMTPSLLELLDTVNDLYGTAYNGILVNKYFNGEDYISAHSDDETNLDESGVVGISWGVTRKFRIRSKTKSSGFTDFPLVSGSMLQMGGDFQKEFTHEIPVEKKVKKVRISFTFRKHTE
jgi:alkylated DNA repair dioxygenase AlkB